MDHQKSSTLSKLDETFLMQVPTAFVFFPECIAANAVYGCEYAPSAKACFVVKGPITAQKAPPGGAAACVRCVAPPGTPEPFPLLPVPAAAPGPARGRGPGGAGGEG